MEALPNSGLTNPHIQSEEDIHTNRDLIQLEIPSYATRAACNTRNPDITSSMLLDLDHGDL